MEQVPAAVNSGFNPYRGSPDYTWERPAFSDLLGAGFRAENDVYNLWQYLSRPSFQPDPEFDILTAGPQSRYWPLYKDQLSRATSAEQLATIEARIAREEADRQLFASAGGAAGLAAAMTAGMVSPTALIPLVGPSRGIKGVAEAFALAAGASTAQEFTLFATQETRTPEEVMMGITAGTVLGGVLGSASVFLKHIPVEELARRAEADMRGIPEELTVSRIDRKTGEAVVERLPLFDRNMALDTSVKLPKAGAGFDTTIDIPRKFPAVDNPDSPGLYLSARETAPEVFREYDNLITFRETVTGWIRRTQDTGEFDVKQTVQQLRQELFELSSAEKETPAIRQRKKAVKEQLNALETATNESGQLEVPRLKETVSRVDSEMQIRAPEIRKAYEKARGDSTPSPDENAYIRGDVVDGPEKLSALGLREVYGSGDSLSAASAKVNVRGLYAQNKFTQAILNTLGKLNPLHRSFIQLWFPSVRRNVAKLSLGGVKLDTGAPFTPASVGGVVADRAEYHHAKVAVFIQRLDDAYARHIYGNRKPEGKLQSALLAKVKSGFSRVPEGKMTWEEFNRAAFQVANTGEEHTDVYVNQAVKAWQELSGYFRQVHDKIYKELQMQDPDIRPLIPENANLGSGVMEYITHIFNTDAIIANGQPFEKALTERQLRALSARFTKAHERLSARREKLVMAIEIQEMPEAELAALQKQLVDDIAELKSDPVFTAGEKAITQLRKELKRAGKPVAEIKEQVSAARAEFGGDYDRVRTRLRVRASEQRFVKKVLKEAKKGPAKSALDEIATLEKQLRQLREEAGPVPTSKEIDAQMELTLKIDELEGKLYHKDDARMRLSRMENDFEELWRSRGATGGDLLNGVADFTEQAVENARLLVQKILGHENRVAGIDILGGKRGPELARGLDIDFKDKQSYLVQDMEKIARIFARHMAPDLELWRSFGSVNAAKMFDEFENDYIRARARIQNATHYVKGKRIAEGTADAPKEQLLEVPNSMRAKELQALERAYNTQKDDLTALIERLRHQRGVPKNANGFMFRLGRLAKEMNVARYMGNVVPASIPDIARPVMIGGLMKTYRHAWLPLVKNLKQVKAVRRELRRVGWGVETVLHNRAQQFAEVLEDYGNRGTALERGSAFLANKTGFVAGFDLWTREMKALAGAVGMSMLADALEVVMRGTAKGKELAKAQRFLAHNGIDSELADRIWRQMLKPGGSEVFPDGFRLPNGENWDDVFALETMDQALIQIMNDTIVTPGLDRPKWMDENMGYSLLAQFRSFSFTSTNRTIMRGIQDADMAVLNGTLFSLALGAVSYYIWAKTVGGKIEQQMQSADAEQWAYQAVSRSGLLGVFGEVQRIGETVPGLREMTMFGGNTTRTRRPTNLISAVAGPTYDLAERLSSVIMGMNDPTQSTLHQARLMTAYQNVFYLRRLLFNNAEDSLANVLDLPETRQ